MVRDGLWGETRKRGKKRGPGGDDVGRINFAALHPRDHFTAATPKLAF